jgi:catechol 2,3-dioxygenase-like lactoylglutathione lyase family enzyme
VTLPARRSDPPAERLDEWRRGEVLFVSLRVSPTFLIDVFQGERTGVNADHLAIVVDDVDLDELAAGGRFEVEMGPADLFGAQGTGRGLYVRDPDGNRIELRTYPSA